eukprot:Hpha_TRINITY_DN12473_c0_g1::TRINITY_DN12473_c0_g1_i1::g.43073::m.43073
MPRWRPAVCLALLLCARRVSAGLVVNEDKLWASPFFYYTIDTVTQGGNADALHANDYRITSAINAIKEVNSGNCFSFTDCGQTSCAGDYIQFVSNDTCRGPIGIMAAGSGGPHVIQIGDTCTSATVLQLILNVMGLRAEHRRVDRDMWIAVDTAAAKTGMAGFFSITTQSRSIFPYDYSSIMHGGTYLYSAAGDETIYAPAGTEIGGDTLSPFDQQTLNWLYCLSSLQKPEVVVSVDTMSTVVFWVGLQSTIEFNALHMADMKATVEGTAVAKMTMNPANPAKLEFDIGGALRCSGKVSFTWEPQAVDAGDYTLSVSFMDSQNIGQVTKVEVPITVPPPDSFQCGGKWPSDAEVCSGVGTCVANTNPAGGWSIGEGKCNCGAGRGGELCEGFEGCPYNLEYTFDDRADEWQGGAFVTSFEGEPAGSLQVTKGQQPTTLNIGANLQPRVISFDIKRAFDKTATIKFASMAGSSCASLTAEPGILELSDGTGAAIELPGWTKPRADAWTTYRFTFNWQGSGGTKFDLYVNNGLAKKDMQMSCDGVGSVEVSGGDFWLDNLFIDCFALTYSASNIVLDPAILREGGAILYAKVRDTTEVFNVGTTGAALLPHIDSSSSGASEFNAQKNSLLPAAKVTVNNQYIAYELQPAPNYASPTGEELTFTFDSSFFASSSLPWFAKPVKWKIQPECPDDLLGPSMRTEIAQFNAIASNSWNVDDTQVSTDWHGGSNPAVLLAKQDSASAAFSFDANRRPVRVIWRVWTQAGAVVEVSFRQLGVEMATMQVGTLGGAPQIAGCKTRLGVGAALSDWLACVIPTGPSQWYTFTADFDWTSSPATMRTQHRGFVLKSDLPGMWLSVDDLLFTAIDMGGTKRAVGGIEVWCRYTAPTLDITPTSGTSTTEFTITANKGSIGLGIEDVFAPVDSNVVHCQTAMEQCEGSTDCSDQSGSVSLVGSGPMVSGTKWVNSFSGFAPGNYSVCYKIADTQEWVRAEFFFSISEAPTNSPTVHPSEQTEAPTPATSVPLQPTKGPTLAPLQPTKEPTLAPLDPTKEPLQPTRAPTLAPLDPTREPTLAPLQPTKLPTTPPVQPTSNPMPPPTLEPSESGATSHPSIPPTQNPSTAPPSSSPVQGQPPPSRGPSNPPKPPLPPSGSPSNAPSPTPPTAAPLPAELVDARCRDVVCTASDSCRLPGECDLATGRCSEPNAPDDTPCDDGDSVTKDDVCKAGVCRGTVQCGSELCGVFDARCATPSCLQDSDGKHLCTKTLKAEGTPCNDNNPATRNDTCLGGWCQGEVMRCIGVVCLASDQCHKAGVCDEATGLCSDPTKPDDTDCDDGDPVTTNDHCVKGTCVGELLCKGNDCSVCDAQCSRPSCQGSDGSCAEVFVSNGTVCNDGNPETFGDSCTSGLCVGFKNRCVGVICVQRSQCHRIGVCENITGICTEPLLPDGTSCDDDLPHTENDTCRAGVCMGRLPCTNTSACDATFGGLHDGACTVPVCQNGTCSVEKKSEGVACVDSRAETTNDTCSNGDCRGDVDRCSLIRCVPAHTCQTGGKCNPFTGECSFSTVADDTACDDGDDKTVGDKCSGGVCKGTLGCGGKQCVSPGVECYKVRCEQGKCVNEVVDDCTPCNDGDPTTTRDICRGGVCAGVSDGVPRQKVPGFASVSFPTNKVIKGKAGGSASLTETVVKIEIDSDALRDLGTTSLKCGVWGDKDASIWLNGTRDEVIQACSASIENTNTLAISFAAGSNLIPSSREVVSVTLRPGLLASGASPEAIKFTIEPEKGNTLESASLANTPPVVPGGQGLALLALGANCPDDGPPEDLILMLHPTRLILGDGDLKQYHGAMVANILILLLLLALCSALYVYLQDRVAKRLKARAAIGISDGRIPRTRLLEAARFGCFFVPLVLLYPGCVLTAVTVLMYSDSIGYRILAAFITLLCLFFPAIVYHWIKNITTWASVDSTEPGGTVEWFFMGKAEWVNTESDWARFRLYHITFDAYTVRDRYYFVYLQLFGLVLAVMQAWKPQTQTWCLVQNSAVLFVVFMHALYMTVRMVHLGPYENLFEPVAAWLEAAVVVMIIISIAENNEEHWSVEVAEVISNVVTFVLAIKAILDISLFFLGEFDHWASLDAGGAKVQGTKQRVLGFLAYWFAFRGVVDTIIAQAQVTDEKEQKLMPKIITSDGSNSDTDDEKDRVNARDFFGTMNNTEGRVRTRSPQKPRTPIAAMTSSFGTMKTTISHLDARNELLEDQFPANPRAPPRRGGRSRGSIIRAETGQSKQGAGSPRVIPKRHLSGHSDDAIPLRPRSRSHAGRGSAAPPGGLRGLYAVPADDAGAKIQDSELMKPLNMNGDAKGLRDILIKRETSNAQAKRGSPGTSAITVPKRAGQVQRM